MLRSYDYFELDHVNEKLKNEALFDYEKALIKKAVSSFRSSKGKVSICPACASDNLEEFFSIWKTIYYRCTVCNSVFMFADEDNAKAFRANKELIAHRKSATFQDDLTERRGVLWDGQLFWIRYRLFRYLKKNADLDVIDYGNRYEGLIRRILDSKIAKNYLLMDSIVDSLEYNKGMVNKADAFFLFDQIQQYANPAEKFAEFGNHIKDGGLLFLSARVGTGFDIMVLKENIRNIFPYEHSSLFSIKGLELALNRAGFTVLEMTTPGIMDIKYVMDHKNDIPSNETFIKYIINNLDSSSLSEFQKFLQKNGLSSFAQIIAKKDYRNE